MHFLFLIRVNTSCHSSIYLIEIKMILSDIFLRREDSQDIPPVSQWPRILWLHPFVSSLILQFLGCWTRLERLGKTYYSGWRASFILWIIDLIFSEYQPDVDLKSEKSLKILNQYVAYPFAILYFHVDFKAAFLLCSTGLWVSIIHFLLLGLLQCTESLDCTSKRSFGRVLLLFMASISRKACLFYSVVLFVSLQFTCFLSRQLLEWVLTLKYLLYHSESMRCTVWLRYI